MSEEIEEKITDLVFNSSIGKRLKQKEYFKRVSIRHQDNNWKRITKLFQLKAEIHLNHRRAIAEMEFRNIFEKETEYKYFVLPRKEQPKIQGMCKIFLFISVKEDNSHYCLGIK